MTALPRHLLHRAIVKVQRTPESALRCKYTMNGGTGQGPFLRNGWAVAAQLQACWGLGAGSERSTVCSAGRKRPGRPEAHA